MNTKVFHKGDVVFREGEPGSSMYRIQKGEVSVSIAAEDGSPIELVKLGKDRIFGEMAILEDWPRSATVTVIADGTTLLEIGQEELNDFFTDDPGQVHNLMANLSRRLRSLTEDYLDVCATIREMDETKDVRTNRSPGLLKRIARFIDTYLRTANYLTGASLEAGSVSYSPVVIMPVPSPVYRKDTVVFAEGDDADNMYYIELGRVGIYTGYNTPEEHLLTELQEKSFFGEMGLIEKLPRSATVVVTEEDTVLREIKDEDLPDLMKTSPDLIFQCLAHLSSRLRSLTKDYLKACGIVSRLQQAEAENGELTEEEKYTEQAYINIAMARTPMIF